MPNGLKPDDNWHHCPVCCYPLVVGEHCTYCGLPAIVIEVTSKERIGGKKGWSND
jgi:hypothetical protein